MNRRYLNHLVNSIILVIGLLILTTRSTFAFSEDFNFSYTYPDIWEVNQNSGLVTLSESEISLTSMGSINRFPYLRTIENIFSDYSRFSVKIKFRYLYSGGFGSGIAISNNPPPYGTYLHSGNHKDYILFLVWQDGAGGLDLWTTFCQEVDPSCARALTKIYDGSHDLGTHEITFSLGNDDKYRIYLDNTEVPIFISATNQQRPIGFWIGHSEITSTYATWANFAVDYIRIDNPAPSQQNRKIIFIPGYGASWDYAAIMSGLPGNNWVVPDWVDIYQNLIITLESAGYQKGTDLFIFAYDWRKNLEALGQDLNSYVTELTNQGKITAEEKLNLVGHSFGGLVARTYTQSHPEKIEKLVTTGSPHQGTPQSYLTWEGGEIAGVEWWQKLGLETIINLHHLPSENRVATVRRLSPSIKDLLPTEPFLYDETGSSAPIGSMKQQNLFLSSLNSLYSGIDALTKVISGDSHNTVESFQVSPSSWIEQILGKWEDGKPISTNATVEGDGTVLKQSALGSFTNNLTTNLDHGALVYSSEGIQAILSELAVTATPVTSAVPYRSDKLLVTMLRSPGQISLSNGNQTIGFGQANTIPHGIYLAEQKMIILPGFSDGDYQITVNGNGESGSYQLLVGNLSGKEPIWEEFQAQVTPEDTDSYLVSADQTKLEVLPFESSADSVEYIADLLSLLDTSLSGWSGPEGARGRWLFESIEDSFQAIQDSPELYMREEKFRSMLQNTQQIWSLADRLDETEAEDLADSLLTATSGWRKELIENYPNLTQADLERDQNYYRNLIDLLEINLASQSSRLTEGKLEMFNRGQTALSLSTDFSDLADSYHDLSIAGIWLDDLNTIFGN